MSAACELIILIPESTGCRIDEDGYLQALERAGVKSCVREFSSSLVKTLQKRAKKYQESGVKLVIYPALGGDIFDWYPAEDDFRTKEKGVFAFDEFQCGGIRLFLTLLQEAGIRTLAVDMHYNSPFDDFEATFYGPPDDFVQELLERAPELRP